MKKSIALFSLATAGVLAVNGFSTQVQAEKKSDADSEVTIQMKAGNEEETRPPVGEPDPEDPENGGTGNTGLLTIDRVPNLKFGDVNISGGDQTEYATNENPYVQVTDVRGTSAGWTLYVKADEFVSSNNDKLTGATLSLKNGVVSSASTGKVIVPPKGSDVTLTKTNQKIMGALAKSGEGTWMESWKKNSADDKNKNISLSILAGTAKANTEYKTTIYWELQDTVAK